MRPAIRRSTVLIALLLACSLMLSACTLSLSDDNLTEEQAREKLSALVSKVRVTQSEPRPDTSWVGTEGTINDLPAIDTKYPLSVRGSGRVDVEIFSSTEKSSKDGSGWLDVQAKKFNDANRSVSIRPIASGSAVGYLTSGTYVPNAYTPSNVLWAEMLKARGVSIEVVSDSLTGNTAGILMKPQTHKDFTAQYGEVTIESVVRAIMEGNLVVAHTDPNVSSTGLNIMTQQLRAFDPTNPFSETSRERMREFSSKVPPVSPTTAEMVKVASSGLADAIISEYQSWKSDPSLKDWVFTPVGVRHDSPLYMIVGDTTPEQAAVLREFAEFCATPQAQADATALGFSLAQVRGVISGLNIPIYTIGYNAEIDTLEELSSMNEAYFTPAETGDVIMKIKELFTAQL